MLFSFSNPHCWKNYEKEIYFPANATSTVLELNSKRRQYFSGAEVLIGGMNWCINAFNQTMYHSLLHNEDFLTAQIKVLFERLRMRNFTWNWFPLKKLLMDSLLSPIVKSTYLNVDMCKFESSQKDESRAQSVDSSKACRKPRVFNCFELFSFYLRGLAITRLPFMAYLACCEVKFAATSLETHFKDPRLCFKFIENVMMWIFIFYYEPLHSRQGLGNLLITALIGKIAVSYFQSSSAENIEKKILGQQVVDLLLT